MGLVGRTVGSVGVGNIGAEMFRLLKPLDVRMIAHDPHADPAALAALGVEAVSLQAVFECSDFVTFNCPLTEATRGIGSAAMIARMQPTAYLVNTSRGPVVRSEEHTSELQSLMRISYAVFCLKKKKTKKSRRHKLLHKRTP